jgi:hypothetical protein
MTDMAERQEYPEGRSQASDHYSPAERNHDQETEPRRISQRNRSSAEHRRLDVFRRLKSISLKTHNGERTALHIIGQEGATLEHAGRRLRESMDAFRVRTVVGKHGIVHTERTPDFEERRASLELVLRLHECLRGPNARIEEPDVFARNTKVDPWFEDFKKCDNVDRNLILRCMEQVTTMIETRKQDTCQERYGLDLKKLEGQLHNEAATQVIEEMGLRHQSPVSEGPLEETSAEGRDSSREVSNGS